MKNSLLLLLLFYVGNAFSASYRWVDENNRVHYSDQPPGKHTTAKLLPSVSGGTAAASTPAPTRSLVERAAELKKKAASGQEAADKAAQEQAQKDAFKANCDTARRNLATLQDGIRLVEMDANGERSYLTDEQRQQRTVKAQQDISEYCK